MATAAAVPLLTLAEILAQWRQFPPGPPANWQEPPRILGAEQSAIVGAYLHSTPPPVGYPGITLHVSTLSRIAQSMKRFLTQESGAYKELAQLVEDLYNPPERTKPSLLLESFKTWRDEYEKYLKTTTTTTTTPYPPLPPRLAAVAKHLPRFLQELEMRVRAHEEHVTAHFFRKLYASLFTGNPVALVQNLRGVFELASLPSDGEPHGPPVAAPIHVPSTLQFAPQPGPDSVPAISLERVYSTAAVDAEGLAAINKQLLDAVKASLKTKLKETVAEAVEAAKKRQEKAADAASRAKREQKEAETEKKEAEKELNITKRDYDKLKADEAKVKTQHTKLLAAKRKLETAIRSLTKKVDRDKGKKERKSEEDVDLDAELADLTKKIAEAKERRKELKKGNKTLSGEVERLTREETDLKEAKRQLANSNATLSSEIEKLRRENDALLRSQTTIKAALDKAKSSAATRLDVLRVRETAKSAIAEEKRLFKDRLAQVKSGMPLSDILAKSQSPQTAVEAEADEIEAIERTAVVLAYDTGAGVAAQRLSEMLPQLASKVDKSSVVIYDPASVQTSISTWIMEILKVARPEEEEEVPSLYNALVALLVKFALVGIEVRRQFIASLIRSFFGWVMPIGAVKTAPELETLIGEVVNDTTTTTLDALDSALDVALRKPFLAQVEATCNAHRDAYLAAELAAVTQGVTAYLAQLPTNIELAFPEDSTALIAQLRLKPDLNRHLVVGFMLQANRIGFDMRHRFLVELFGHLVAWFGAPPPVDTIAIAANASLEGFREQLEGMRTFMSRRLAEQLRLCGAAEPILRCLKDEFKALLEGKEFSVMPPSTPPPPSPSATTDVSPQFEVSAATGSGKQKRKEPGKAGEKRQPQKLTARKSELSSSSSMTTDVALVPAGGPPVVVTTTRRRGVIPPALAQTMAATINVSGGVEQTSAVASTSDVVNAVSRLP